MRRPRNRMMYRVGSQLPAASLCDPALIPRRRMLVNSLFKYAGDIQSLADGYALRFLRSQDRDEQEELIGTIADYIIFESRNAPQLTFEIVGESSDKAFWLQIRGLQPDYTDVTSASRISEAAVPSDEWHPIGCVRP